MKKIYWIIIILTVALGVSVIDGLRIRDKYSISIGNYQAELVASKKAGAALTLQIGEMQMIVAQQNTVIAERDKVIGHLTNTIGHRDADLTQLVQKLHGLEANGNLPAQVANLKEQIAVWSTKFSLAQAIIAEKDKVISAWAAKYDAQVVISGSWKAKYDAECRLLQLATQGWKVAEGKLRWTRVTGNIKTGIIIAAAIKIGADMIKGT